MKKLFSFAIALLAAISLNAADYYLVGSCQGWSNGNETYKFVEKEGVLTLEVAKFDGMFKIVEGKEWHPQYGGIYIAKDDTTTKVPDLKFNTPYTLTKEVDGQGDPSNITVELADKHYYKDAVLTLNVTNPDAPVITLISGTDIDDSAKPITYQLIGACTNWSLDDAIEFKEVEGVLTANVPDLSGTFKIIEDRKWDMQYATNWDTKAGLEFNTPYVLGAKSKEKGEPDNLSLANPFGGYKNAVLTLTEDADSNKVLTLTTGDFYVVEADWYMPGEKLGWNCDDKTKFTAVEGKENTFELLEAEFSGEFKVSYGEWAVEFGQDAENTKWEVNKEYNLQLKGGNVQPIDAKATFIDATITIVVDYENVAVKLLIDATPSGVENTKAIKNANTVKVVENGQLYIIREGVRYNALGAVVAE